MSEDRGQNSEVGMRNAEVGKKEKRWGREHRAGRFEFGSRKKRKAERKEQSVLDSAFGL
jgi:hypothetical protein